MAKSIDENIQSLSRSVLSEAQAEAEQILTDARAKVEAIRQSAEEQAAAERTSILARAAREEERIRRQAISAAQLKARTYQLVQRDAMIDEVFQAVRQKLASVQQRRDYEQIVSLLLHESLLHLRASTVQIRADETTNKYLTSQMVNQASSELKVKVQAGPVLAQGHGIIVETIDGHRRYDDTLETRLKRIENSLRAQVYSILLGK
jgi:V/A-type H+/Na+-transporting ATPase subunit E